MILIADDDPIVTRVLKPCLEQAGYQVMTAKSAREAIELANRQLPQLIILDVLMPQMDGLRALRQLKNTEATKEIPVIVLTSSALRLTQLEAAASGADLFLTKPFSKSQLLRGLQRLVSERAPANPAPALK